MRSIEAQLAEVNRRAETIRRRLKHRHLPEETKEYMTFDKYNIDRKDILE